MSAAAPRRPHAEEALQASLRASLENARRIFSAPHPSGSNLSARGPKENNSIAGVVKIHMVGDEGFRGCCASAPAAGGCAALACSAANGCAVHALRTPNGVRIPMHGALMRNGAIAGAVIFSMVGDEGFEPPALCV